MVPSIVVHISAARGVAITVGDGEGNLALQEVRHHAEVCAIDSQGFESREVRELVRDLGRQAGRVIAERQRAFRARYAVLVDTEPACCGVVQGELIARGARVRGNGVRGRW